MFWRRNVLSAPLLGPALPPRRARRPDPPVVCPGFGLDRFLDDLNVFVENSIDTGRSDLRIEALFPDMPCSKRFYREKQATVCLLVSSQEQRSLLFLVIKRR